MLYIALALLAILRLEAAMPPRLTRRWSLVAGTTLAAAAVTRPPLLPAAVLLFLVVVTRRSGATAWMLAGAGAVIGVLLAVDLATFGNALAPYYRGNRVGMGATYPEALAANLVSPSRGLVIFSPAVLLAPVGAFLAWRGRSPNRAVIGAAGLGAVATWLAVSGLVGTWWAGNTFGPRFMTDTIPLLVVVACPALDRLARAGASSRGAILVAAALAWGLVVNAQGAVLRSTTCWNAVPVNIDHKPSRVWDWSDPQFLTGVRTLVDHGPRTALLGDCPVSGPGAIHARGCALGRC